MGNRYQWPKCTYPGCGHAHTWPTLKRATAAIRVHPDWIEGDAAICTCHGDEGGATFPCDRADQLTPHA